ncbi:hypothetical protein EVAR_39719_1 [Eumeta japonica]|uniref:Uncharacterized protein n=1 Tax=Eumeta variegata TaxID=151549 RepID=A0A4C1W722_EUMVA|nr:hypothetical protein EVAR_39719_1 [Eumeta japonica]
MSPVMIFTCQKWSLTVGPIKKLKENQRAMERTEKKKLRGIESKTKISPETILGDAAHKINKLKWQWANRIFGKTDNRWGRMNLDWQPLMDIAA